MAAATPLKIGFLPLADAAPLVMAFEKGLFAAHGLDVQLVRMNSWSQIRDRLAIGDIDAAHMLAPMVPASWLKGAYAEQRFVTALSLNLNGNAITVSNDLYQELLEADTEAMAERPVTARAMRALIARRIKTGQAPPTIGTVFPYSSHNYALRYWLGAEGINPDRDVRMVVAPPPMMVAQLEAGQIDAFCVGEPWNSYAEQRGTGRAIVSTNEIWRHFPEKVLGVRARWAQDHQEAHQAMVAAVLQASQWLDLPRNRREAAHILSAEDYVGVSPTVLGASLLGEAALRSRKSLVQSEDFLVFHHYAANFPWPSHALWFLTQMVRWGQITQPHDMLHIANNCYLPELYRAAAGVAGCDAPLGNHKTEGGHDKGWLLETNGQPVLMPPSAFIDGGLFNPADPARYMESFLRHNMRVQPNDVTGLD